MQLEAIAQDLTQRFPSYCEIGTGSISDVVDEAGKAIVPSTPGQKQLAEILAEEARELGYQVDFLKGGLRIRATATKEGIVPLLFGAHLDTSEDAPNDKVKVLKHENYDGNVIHLPHIDRRTGEEATTIIDPANCKYLKDYVGDTIFTSDGSTLLGGDDKAGISAIMTFLKYLSETGEDHGEIDAVFTYDEEIGLEGACLLDTTKETNAKYGVVFDGAEGEIGIGSFNAASAYVPVEKLEVQEVTGQKVKITIDGSYVHPGFGKTLGMVDAFRLLPQVYDALENAEATVTNVSGSVDGIELEVIVESIDEIDWITGLEDNRFNDEARANCPVKCEIMKEVATASQAYNLEPIVRTVNGIDYEISAEKTEGMEGYIQPLSFKEVNGKLQVRTLLRDFETQGIRNKEKLMGELVPEAPIEQEYMNKADILLGEAPHLVDAVEKSMQMAGVLNIRREYIRGGDESVAYTISSETLAGVEPHGRRIHTVNGGVMGENLHSQREYQLLGGMVRAVKTMINLNTMAVNKELV